jgi:hypothetical protein
MVGSFEITGRGEKIDVDLHFFGRFCEDGGKRAQVEASLVHLGDPR